MLSAYCLTSVMAPQKQFSLMLLLHDHYLFPECSILGYIPVCRMGRAKAMWAHASVQSSIEVSFHAGNGLSATHIELLACTQTLHARQVFIDLPVIHLNSKGCYQCSQHPFRCPSVPTGAAGCCSEVCNVECYHANCCSRIVLRLAFQWLRST